MFGFFYFLVLFFLFFTILVASCRHPNRCVCPRGFRGRRCEISSKVHTPNHRAIGTAPEPMAGSQVVTLDWGATREPVLKPFSPQAQGQESRFSESTVKFGYFEAERGGLPEMLLMNDASRKSSQVRRTAGEATPDVNHLQPQQTNSPDVESVVWPQAEGPVTSLRPATVEPLVAQKLPEIQSVESKRRSAADQGPSAAPSLEDKHNLEANLGREELKSVAVNVLSDEERKEKKKKVKSGGARKQSLR